MSWEGDGDHQAWISPKVQRRGRLSNIWLFRENAIIKCHKRNVTKGLIRPLCGKQRKYLAYTGTSGNVQNCHINLSGFGFNKTIDFNTGEVTRNITVLADKKFFIFKNPFSFFLTTFQSTSDIFNISWDYGNTKFMNYRKNILQYFETIVLFRIFSWKRYKYYSQKYVSYI